MNDDKLRRRIAIEAARLLVDRKESVLSRARIRAARQVRGWAKPAHFPSETEIRDEIERLSYVSSGDARFDNLLELRLFSLELLRLLKDFSPRLSGPAWSGEVRHGTSIDILLAEDALPLDESISAEIAQLGWWVQPAPEPPILLRGELRIGEDTTHPSYTLEIRKGAAHEEGGTLDQFEEMLRQAYPDLPINEETVHAPGTLDRFQVYRMLLAPLEQVQQRRRQHPEGDALYHSLQVYQLASDELPYDEEFQLAALLHDVGKGIDPIDPVRATLDALGGYVTERTAWLIENLADGERVLDQTIGTRAWRRLQQSPDYEELLVLVKCNREGRVAGAKVPTLDEALEQIRELARDLA